MTLIIALFVCPAVYAQSNTHSAAPEPRAVTFCDLAEHPAAHNGGLVRITSFVTHGFEDFHLADPTCATQGFRVWVMYGGKAQSDTMYCCPGEAAAKERSAPLSIDGLEIPLVNDSKFQQFTTLLKNEPDTTVRFTAVGRFFSGQKQTVNGVTHWGGAGHMSCCSLFAIQRVESFEPHTRGDLDYTSEAGWYENEGCKYKTLRYVRHVSIPYPEGVAEVIAEQRKADSGEGSWAFNDPQRVASESLKTLYPDEVPVLKRMKNTRARQVFWWNRKNNRVVVVVTRPYWLSFYARSNSVAWVSTNIKEAGCH